MYSKTRGINVVGVLVAMVLVSVLAIGIQRLIVSGTRGARHVATVDELTTIRQTLRNNLDCQQTLGDPSSLPVACAGPYKLRRDDGSLITDDNGIMGSWLLEAHCEDNELIIDAKKVLPTGEIDPKGFQFTDIYKKASDFCRKHFGGTVITQCDPSKGEAVIGVDLDTKEVTCGQVTQGTGFSGVARVGYLNGQVHSTMRKVNFPFPCPNPVIVTQSLSGSIACCNPLSPQRLGQCSANPSSRSQDIRSYARAVTSTGFRVFLSADSCVCVGVVGASPPGTPCAGASPAYGIAYHVTCSP